MLTLATFYVNREAFGLERDEQLIDLEYVAIFLVMHTADTLSKPASPSISYETIWPTLGQDSDNSPQSPIAPLSPPNLKDGGRGQRKGFSMSGSPLSPRSPKNSPKSPRSQVSNSRQPRSTAQYLHIVRQKIPIILKSLAIDDMSSVDALDVPILSKSASFDRESLQSTEFSVSKKTVDSLGLIISGGLSRDQHVQNKFNNKA